MPTYTVDICFASETGGIDESIDKLTQLSDTADKVKEDLKGLEDEEKGTEDETKKMGDSSEEAASKVDLLGDAVSAVASLGLAAEFNNTAMAADKYNVSMAALEQVANNNNISLDGTSQAIQKVTDATSIGGGQARSYFTMLMNLGVTNTNALADSMIALKGQSAITGGSIEQMSSKLTTIVNGTSLSARSLTNLGISLQQLATTNGMSVEEMKSSWATFTPDQKLQALNNAMAENSSLVTTMNQTTSEQLQEVQNSWAGLEIEVGQSSTVMNQAILGTTNGAIKALTFAVKNIPFASTFASGAMAVGSLVTGIKPAVDTFNSLSMSVKNSMDMIKGAGSALRTMRDMVNAVREAESLAEGVRAAVTIATGAEAAAETANAGVKSASIAPTLGLAAAENSLLWPFLLVAAAIIAVIAILWYLYNTNESVRNGINNLINGIRNFINNIIVTGQIIVAFVQNAINQISQLPGRIGAFIVNTASRILSGVNQWKDNMVHGAQNMINNAVSIVSSLPGKISSAIAGVKDALVKPFTDAYNTIKSKVDAIGALANSINPFSGADFEGFSNVDYEGFSTGTLNSSISSSTSSNNKNVQITNNNNFNGIIENDAKEWVINTLNEKVSDSLLTKGV